MNRYLIEKPSHGTNEWLYLRHRTPDGKVRVAASEAAAVHGQHRFMTKYGLAVAKMADHPEESETTRAMERGNRLESTLLNWLSDMVEIELAAPKQMYCCDGDGFHLIATLDGVNEFAARMGEPPEVVAEIKTYNREWDGELPPYWYWQGVQQAICTGVEEIIWGVFDRTLNLHVHHQRVTNAEKELHIEAVKDFLWFVEIGSIPAEWPATYDEVQSAFNEVTGKSADLTESAQLVNRLKDVMAQKKLLSDEEDELKAAIGAALGGNEIGLIDGQPLVTWKQQSRTGFNTKKFSSEHPDLFEKYQTVSSYRVMRLKGEK